MEINRRAALKGAAAVLVGSAGLLAERGVSQAATRGYSLRLNRDQWHYDATNDVYYQLGKYYVSKPAAPAYENLGVYVPGKYLHGTKNSAGLYSVTINRSGRVGGFTAATAPIVFPVNTPGYAAQQPPTSYSDGDVSAYLEEGFVYVAAGLRGRDSETSTYYGNAPWGVTDLKSAIRYIRYNADLIPGDTERIFVFGMSGGGAQSAVTGASGDSRLYQPYLKSIGAAFTDLHGRTLSDAVAGAMCWCPITSLDMANAAYEWNMGQFASSGTRAAGTWTKAYSDDLSDAFAGYVNALALKNASGQTLGLTRSANGRYLAGSYYDNLIDVIETSLNDFLSYTTFPYTQSSGMGGGPPSGSGFGGPPSGSSTTGGPPSGFGSGGPGGSSASATYKTVEKYFEHLNSVGTWVELDSSKKTAKVLRLRGFIESQKQATKDVGAFDGIVRGATENLVFGHGTNPLHFARISQSLIAANQHRYSKYKDWAVADGASAYDSDLAKTDTVGENQIYRVNMYNPMYYLSAHYDGYKTSKVAPNWRIRTGIMQGDTANTVEINLALALRNLGVRNVDFATVWGEAHTMAETTGQPTTNFIKWVKESV
jgi:hypothetical protein